MKIIEPSFEILTDIHGDEILAWLEGIARTCYKSEEKSGNIEKTKRFMIGLINRGHEAMIEHYNITVKFVVDRGLSHELVRHRLAAFAQESTRYCNYSGNGIEVIMPYGLSYTQKVRREWLFWECQRVYESEINEGVKPEIARGVLPMALKTEIIVTANLREWRHIFELRALGVTGKPHPQMQKIMLELLKAFQEKIHVIFDDMGEK